MRTIIHKWLLATFILLTVVAESVSQVKPKVSIQFFIDDPVYWDFYDQLSASGASDAEAATTQAIIQQLVMDIPYLEFTTDFQPNNIRFTLSTQNETYIRPILTSAEGTFPADAIVYRDAVSVFTENPPATIDAFALDVQNTCMNWISVNKETLVRDFFGQIKVGTKAYPFPQFTQWIMPFTMEALKIGKQSGLEIKTSINWGAGIITCEYPLTAQGKTTTTNIPQEYKGKMFCNFKTMDVNPECVEKMQTAEIEGVYLKKFIPLTLAQSTTPSGQPQ